MSVVFRVAYDGTAFHGFSRQAGLRTVQGDLEQALSRVHGTPIVCRGASRTDAGVHALGQIVAFEPVLKIPARGHVLAVNAELPDDLSVLAAWVQRGRDRDVVSPRFENLGKHYRYTLSRCKVRDPIADRTRWRFHQPLDLDAMRAAARSFVGVHDFAGFRAGDCQAKTTKRRITHVEITPRPVVAATGRWREHDAQYCGALGTDWSGDEPCERIVAGPDKPYVLPRAVVDIDVYGDAFLKNMVRIMVGSLVEIGRGRRPAEWISELLLARCRPLSGPTAPACGLTLVEVRWPAFPEL